MFRQDTGSGMYCNYNTNCLSLTWQVCSQRHVAAVATLVLTHPDRRLLCLYTHSSLSLTHVSRLPALDDALKATSLILITSSSV